MAAENNLLLYKLIMVLHQRKIEWLTACERLMQCLKFRIQLQLCIHAAGVASPNQSRILEFA